MKIFRAFFYFLFFFYILMVGMLTKCLRRTSFGMKKLRSDFPVYNGNSATICDVIDTSSFTNESQYEEPYIRKMRNIKGATAPTFSIMSYNILAECNLIDNGQYRHSPSWALPVQYRLNNIVKEIETYNPDIVCLQEVDHADEISEALYKKGYSSEFHARGGRFPEGCQTLFKSEKFKLVHVEKLRFNQMIEEYGVNKRDFKRSNVAQLLVLELDGYNNSIIVGNTHLYWDPSFEYVKLAQAHFLMHSIDNLKKKQKKDYPVVVCGDFNSKPDSRVYELIKRGLPKERAKRKDILLHTHQTPLVSAYESIGDPYTNFASVFNGTLDYIFYSNSSLSVTSLLEEVNADSPPLQKYKYAPNPIMPSDHIPIMATLALEKE